MRLSILFVALLAVLGSRGPASASVINLMSADMVEPGHSELWTLGYYAPYDLRVLNGVTYAANPVGSGYHWAELWSSFEAGLMPDTSLTVIAPYNLSQRFDGSAHTAGFGNVEVGVSRRLWQNDRGTLKSRLHGDVPVGDPVLGASPGLGLDVAVSQEVLARFLTLTGNLGYLYNLRTTSNDPMTNLPNVSWHGQRFQLGGAIEAHLASTFSFITEVLAQADTPSESNRQGVANSSDGYVLVAPGATWELSKQLSLQGSVAIPVVRGGTLDSYRFTTAFGARYRF